MRNKSVPKPRGKEARPASLVDRLLPPDPKAPPRPTIPPPNCGTLPPALPSALDLLGTLRKFGR